MNDLKDIKTVIDAACSLTFVQSFLEKELGKFYKNDLTPRQSLILLTIYTYKDPTISDIQKLIGVGQSAISDQFKRLKKAGLVRLENDVLDARFSRIRLKQKAIYILESKIKDIENIAIDLGFILENVDNFISIRELLLSKLLDEEKQNKK